MKPLQTTVPIYSTFSGILSAPLRFLTHRQGKATERGAALIKTGLDLRRVLARRRRGAAAPLPRSPAVPRGTAALDPAVKYTATYYDASMHDPERSPSTCSSTGSRPARRRAPATCGGRPRRHDGVRVRDGLTGEEFAIAADVVVNTSGPGPTSRTRSSVVPRRSWAAPRDRTSCSTTPSFLAATAGREIFFEHEDGRIVLIYPLKGA